MPFLEIPVFIASMVLVLITTIFSLLMLKKYILKGSCGHWTAILIYFLITFPSPAVAYLIILLTANFVNNRPDRFVSNLRGSIWNGDADLLLLFIFFGLFISVGIANILFAISVLILRRTAQKQVV